LPKEFSYRGEEDYVDYFPAADKQGNVFHIVRVTYGFGGTQHRIYSFVFDSDGKCILRLNESSHFANGGLFDFTGDGMVEKILTFHRDKSNGEIQENSRYDSAFQVWRLQTPSPYILLHVRFNFFPGDADDPSDFTRVHIDYSEKGKPRSIQLVGTGFKPRLIFSWSQEKKEFICSGLRRSKYWEVLFPQADGEP